MIDKGVIISFISKSTYCKKSRDHFSSALYDFNEDPGLYTHPVAT